VSHPQLVGQPELGVAAAHAVGGAGPVMDSAQPGDQVRVLEVTGRGGPVPPLVVARRGDLQDPAGHRDREPGLGELTDQPEPYFGSTFSRAK